MDKIPEMVKALAKALPIESIESISMGRTTTHIQGTVVMGNNPATSVVDRHLVHHQIRNLLVLGASAYPTAGLAYPTLMLSALSLLAADYLLAKGAKMPSCRQFFSQLQPVLSYGVMSTVKILSQSPPLCADDRNI